MEEIKDLKKAAGIILKAVKAKKRFIVYADSDLDGTTSAVIMKEALKSLGGNVVAVYFPDREKDGYGINKTGLKFLKKYAPAFLISVDLGISNYKEIQEAKKLGFKVIVLDHHEALGKIPLAEAVVDPKQKDDKYPFKGLSAAGVVFRLAEVLFEGRMFEFLKKSFLELVALSTIADMVPRESENLMFIEDGLASLKDTLRPGLKAFFKGPYLEEFYDFPLKVNKMIGILNVRDVKDGEPGSFRLLTCPSVEEAKVLIEDFMAKNQARRERIEKIVYEVGQKIRSTDPLIFVGGEDFDAEINSSIASILSQKHEKPAFIFKKMEKESQGTVRVPHEVNSLELLEKCSKLLITYGGHVKASGFRLKNSNLEKFKECLFKALKK
jgi:single-stranded-DNA-specific exonuclease